MDILTLIAIIEIGIFTIFLYLFFFKLYPKYRVSQFKRSIFSLREDLFERAADGELHFDSEAYGMLRITLNGLLRSAENLSIWRVLWLKMTLPENHIEGYNEDYEEVWNKRINALSAEEKEILEKFKSDMEFETLRFIALRSILGFIAATACILLLDLCLVLGRVLRAPAIKAFKMPMAAVTLARANFYDQVLPAIGRFINIKELDERAFVAGKAA